jgi:hypothetical protein
MPNIFQFEAIYVLYISMHYQFVNGLNVELISLALVHAQEHFPHNFAAIKEGKVSII